MRISIRAVVAAFACAALSTQAIAGVTTVSFGSASVIGENWAKGFSWNVRAILLDSSGQPVGSLSSTRILNTASAPMTPNNAKVHLDVSAPVGSVIRVYRDTAPFNAGANVEYADYNNLCPCVPGDLFLTTSGTLPDSDFSKSAPAMPVGLKEFSVD